MIDFFVLIKSGKSGTGVFEKRTPKSPKNTDAKQLNDWIALKGFT